MGDSGEGQIGMDDGGRGEIGTWEGVNEKGGRPGRLIASLVLLSSCFDAPTPLAHYSPKSHIHISTVVKFIRRLASCETCRP